MRVQLNAAGQVELKLETPWRDGNTHVVMLPLKFIQQRIEGGFSEVESVSYGQQRVGPCRPRLRFRRR